MLKTKVGEKLNIFDNVDLYKDFEGAVFEINNDGIFDVVIFLPNMSEKERQSLKTKRIETRILKKENMIITYIRYIGTQLIFELPIDPTIYNDDKKGLLGKSNQVIIYGVDSNDLIVKNMRFLSMPKTLFNKLISNWSEAQKASNFSSNYTLFKSSLQKFRLVDLWEKAEYCGKLGE